ncbi:hypothetical protein ACFL0V_02050 [Nanoarchaeota archaeon]
MKLSLESIESYKESSIEHLKWKLSEYFGEITDMSVVKNNIENLNAYENLEHLKPLSEEHVVILDEDNIDTVEAQDAVLKGEVLWEHAAAGEATRLGLGTKYLLYMNEFPAERVIDMQRKELYKDFKKDPELLHKKLADLTPENLRKQMGCDPEETMPISLGTRHMLQMVFDLRNLAEKKGLDADAVVKRQHMLIILNEATGDRIVDEFVQYGHFGLDPKKTLFMIQKSFHGIDINDGKVGYDESNDGHKRLHNHGQMAMQKVHDEEVFCVDGERKHLSSDEFEEVLKGKKDMISFNIEDINYLTGSIDWKHVGLVLELAKKGYGMVMEIVGQNPLRPQKGGAAFFDEKKGRPVMVESNQLKGINAEEIEHLNKNHNHYPNPWMAFAALRKEGMNLHTRVFSVEDRDGQEKDYLYFCTPQGDINFLVKTAYVMRKELKPIANWKSPATTPPTVKACFEQDKQEGFKEFAEGVLGERF